MARTAYWVIDLSSYTAPTNAQIAAGQRTGSVAAFKSGSEAFAATTGGGTITEATTVTGLSAGIEYRLSWTIYDDVAADYPASAPLHATFITNQQFLPTSDVTDGAWLPSTGADLYAAIDESAYSDTDYIYTSSASTSEVALTTGSDPASSANHVIRYRAKGVGGGLTVRLVQGTTIVASHTPTLTGSFQDFTYTLSGAEADAITNYADLRLRFVSS
jgi:hypothetical protein